MNTNILANELYNFQVTAIQQMHLQQCAIADNRSTDPAIKIELILQTQKLMQAFERGTYTVISRVTATDLPTHLKDTP